MVFTRAALQAAAMFTAPVEKFSIAGVRPRASSPSRVTRQAAEVGSNTPTVFSPGVMAASLPPRM